MSKKKPRSPHTDLTFERADSLLEYNQKTGLLTWKKKRYCAQAGAEAGWLETNGYRRLSIDGVKYWAHRVCWLLSTGELPENDIDHINGVRSDNRRKNLRSCTRAENHQNNTKRSTNTSGYLGVSFRKSDDKWRAQITVNGKKRCVGLHDTPEEAYESYLRAKSKLHTFNPVPRDEL